MKFTQVANLYASNTQSLITALGWKIAQDGSGNLGIYDTGGTEIGWISEDGSSNIELFTQTGKLLILSSQDFSSKLWVGPNVLAASYKFTTYNGLPTAGLGVPAIYVSNDQSKTNAAFTTVSYTPPSTAGHYRMSAELTVTTGTTLTFKAAITFKDENGSATTLTGVGWRRDTGLNTVLSDPTANTTGKYFMVPIDFDIDNSGTAITFQDNTGTYTTCAYKLHVKLEQMS